MGLATPRNPSHIPVSFAQPGIGRGRNPKAPIPAPVTGISTPGVLSFSTALGRWRELGNKQQPGKQHPGTSRWAPAPCGETQMGSRLARCPTFRDHTELPTATSAKPSALGGSGANQRPPTIAPWGYGPGEPRRTRGAADTRIRPAPKPSQKSRPRYPLDFPSLKSRPGYPREGRATKLEN